MAGHPQQVGQMQGRPWQTMSTCSESPASAPNNPTLHTLSTQVRFWLTSSMYTLHILYLPLCITFATMTRCTGAEAQSRPDVIHPVPGRVLSIDSRAPQHDMCPPNPIGPCLPQPGRCATTSTVIPLPSSCNQVMLSFGSAKRCLSKPPVLQIPD